MEDEISEARLKYLEAENIRQEKEIIELEELVKQLENGENSEIDEWRQKAKRAESMARDWKITGKALNEKCGEYIEEIKELKSQIVQEESL